VTVAANPAKASKPFKPYLWHRRHRVWYIVYPGPAPAFRKRNVSTTFRTEQHDKAKKALALFIERLARAERVEGTGDEGPLTVRRLMEKWLTSREKKGISTVDDYRSWIENHVLPIIGDMLAAKVDLEDIEGVMDAIKARGTLAPRSQRRVYESMHAMFGWAVPRLLESNPCGLKAEELPANEDADPEWRKKAIFTRKEVVAILTDTRIPVDRRVFYAVMFLAGCRFGEISALRWRHYEPEVEPLGRLEVAFSYNSTKRKLKGTKTKKTRLVPVHSTLAIILDWWHDVGWPEMMGRPPGPDDIMIPTKHGTHRHRATGWQQLNGRPARAATPATATRSARAARPRKPGDLERIGLRPRRQHDTRRTFITLCRGNGARTDLLKLATHGPEGDIMDVYTEMLVVWQPVCAEVAKLELDLSKSAKPEDPMLAKVAMEVAMPEMFTAIESLRSDPTGNRTRKSAKDKGDQTGPNEDRQRDPARIAPARPIAFATIAGHPRSPATVATLALRQALAALERGRIDQVREILLQLIKQEADVREAVS
jgi:integrase